MIFCLFVAIIYIFACLSSILGQENVVWQRLRRRSLPLEVVEANTPNFTVFSLRTPFMLVNMKQCLHFVMEHLTWTGMDSSALLPELMESKPQSSKLNKEVATFWQWAFTKILPVETALLLFDEPIQSEQTPQTSAKDGQDYDFLMSLDTTRRRLVESFTFPTVILAQAFSLIPYRYTSQCLIAADKCNPQHLVCEQVVDLVCGCDGNTYINACFARYYYCNSNWTNGACPTAALTTGGEVQLHGD